MSATHGLNVSLSSRPNCYGPIIGLLLCALAAPLLGADREPLVASAGAIELDRQIDWTKARLMVVQDAGRYKTLESFARESLSAMTGQEHLPGLSPVASLFEWLFHRSVYVDTPLVRIRSKGLRLHFSAHMTPDRRQRIVDTGYMTPRELAAPTVQQRLRQLEPLSRMATAIGRVRDAEAVVFFLDQMLRIVPTPDPTGTAPWQTPAELLDGTAADAAPASNAAATTRLAESWSALRDAWLSGDTRVVQEELDRLAAQLPLRTSPGVYPTESQRRAEARYYRMGKLMWGWGIYFLGALVSIWALVTRWRAPWLLALGLLGVAMAIHAYGLGLRWYILGHIPVANMFEAVISSAWIGVAIALAVELAYRTRVFLLGAHLTGFLALVLGSYVIPGGGQLTTIMGILDDVMLRIHTVLIIASYALIFLAAVVAVVYLLGYYALPRAQRTRTVPTRAEGKPRNRPDAVAGAGSADEALPDWLNHFDWSHLIVLHLVFVMLFAGIVFGAVWADYSWGRPWGWDPKEVFALNTWIIYAVLIHTRFVVRARGVWTAWLSVAGCLMMMFNWVFVNYYIVGLHSYA
jgi:cytochrome c-type biogenesis protein CcsB